jgi:hypothetical protein
LRCVTRGLSDSDQGEPVARVFPFGDSRYRVRSRPVRRACVGRRREHGSAAGGATAPDVSPAPGRARLSLSESGGVSGSVSVASEG